MKPLLKNISQRLEPREGKLVEEQLRDDQNVTIGRPLANGGGLARTVSFYRTPQQIRADFWARVDVRNPDQCWEWKKGLKGRARNQYGIVWIDRKSYGTHQVAYTVTKGEVPAGMNVLHTCDNPPCCNPNHLFLGTHKDNIHDCISKGRYKKEMGSDRYNAKLTEAQVERIKREAPTRKYGWGRRLAREFGVGPSAINNIVKGRRWKQVQVAHPKEARARGWLLDKP